MKRYYFDTDMRGDPKAVEHEEGGLVYYKDVQCLQAERDRLNASLAEAQAERDRLSEVVKIGAEAESLFVELTSDGRLDIRTEAAMELCEVFQRFQDARKALEGEGK